MALSVHRDEMTALEQRSSGASQPQRRTVLLRQFGTPEIEAAAVLGLPGLAAARPEQPQLCRVALQVLPCGQADHGVPYEAAQVTPGKVGKAILVTQCSSVELQAAAAAAARVPCIQDLDDERELAADLRARHLGGD